MPGPPAPRPPTPQGENPFQGSEGINRLMEMMRRGATPPQAPRTLSGGIEGLMRKLGEKVQPAMQSLQERAAMERQAREANKKIWREETEFPGFAPDFEQPGVRNAPGVGPPLPAWWGKDPQASLRTLSNRAGMV